MSALNKGIHCFRLARSVGPSGRVVAFEPQPEMLRYIEARKKRFSSTISRQLKPPYRTITAPRN